MAEQDKIDLWSSSFYCDALDFYREKTNEKQRDKLIKGIGYLSAQIKMPDEFIYINEAWKRAQLSMPLRIAIEKRKSGWSLTEEFYAKVDNILETAKENFFERERKKQKAQEALKKGRRDDKIKIDSLIDTIVKINSGTTPEKAINKTMSEQIPFPINMEILIQEVKFNFRDKFKSKIEELIRSKANPQKAKKNEFTAIASIFYNMVEISKDKKTDRWISKKTAFAEWLRIFSEAFHRDVPKYKETRVKPIIDRIIIKAPFLDNRQ